MGVLDSPRLAIAAPLCRQAPPGLPLIDRALAVGALLASIPMVAVAGAVVWRLSGRTPLVAIRRVGRDGEPFWMLKLRTMWHGDPAGRAGRFVERAFIERAFIERIHEDWVPERKNGRDPRVTSRFAALCRRFSIDELPQLWHVVTGDMSIVGPRPLTAGELDRHYGPAMREVLQLRPGLTGLWQVHGRNELSYGQRLEFDLRLARQYGWKLYWSVLWRTIPCVLRAKDAW